MPSREDVMIAARRKLIAAPDFAALIGTDVGIDAVGGAYTDAWVFRSSDDTYSPDRNPRNTGTSAVVLGMSDDNWTAPNNYNTLRFPVLAFRVYSDSTRGSDPALMIQKDARDRCDRVATAIISTFNDVGNNDHTWPNGVDIVSCVLWNDLVITDIDLEDGLVVGDLSFALELG